MTITIFNVQSREDAGPIQKILHGKSYMDLQVALAPARGSFDVTVTTSRRDVTEEQLTQMVMLLLCGYVTTGARAAFDPARLPPRTQACSVIDAMARELASAARLLQDALDDVAAGSPMTARDNLPDIPSLRPARQYLLGLADGGRTR